MFGREVWNDDLLHDKVGERDLFVFHRGGAFRAWPRVTCMQMVTFRFGVKSVPVTSAVRSVPV